MKRKKSPDILKSSRHAKTTGDFGEILILYWLSKYGFECALIDHTGIDIIARNPSTGELMGISVKSRCRSMGAEETYITVPNENFDKMCAACDAFGCIPYFAFVVDAADTIRAFLVSMGHFLELFPKGKTASGWKMRSSYIRQYEADPEVKSFVFRTETANWWCAPGDST